MDISNVASFTLAVSVYVVSGIIIAALLVAFAEVLDSTDSYLLVIVSAVAVGVAVALILVLDGIVLGFIS